MDSLRGKKDLWDWLTKSELKCKTESLLVDTQDQALNINSVQKNIYHQVNSDKFRLCGMKVENITHIISTCVGRIQALL